ncbi:Sec-independent protein translocase, TatC subunit [Thermosinus carboxydivorans Nor1]|uniref:Sec-independent protein translocase protein TatC n=1 Tax=Thermosinus carboxydivorans Nor1 TaxID=401526 RepID=A1HS12_9FIRM|nr:twin-arginine translocase subunit TatC [Thermosinus carboxydivorans]EAX47188.1 Sec-independent protein translocase, TatC subunit [Thermosinus carboxydivorans Nor1]
MESQEFYSLLSHIIARARRRLLWLILLLAGTSTLGYWWADGAMKYMFRMVRQVIFVSPAEAFVTKIKVALTIGLVLALPLLLYLLIGVVRTRVKGLTPTTHVLLTAVSFGLFTGGAAFCFYAVLPVGIQFLLDFATLEMQPLLSAGRFVSFVLMCLLVFGIMFELPLVIMLLTSMGILTVEKLRAKRRHAILGVFIIAGIITPSPDVLSQILLALPLLALYEIGIFLTRFCTRPVERLPELPADQQQLFM